MNKKSKLYAFLARTTILLTNVFLYALLIDKLFHCDIFTYMVQYSERIWLDGGQLFPIDLTRVLYECLLIFAFLMITKLETKLVTYFFLLDEVKKEAFLDYLHNLFTSKHDGSTTSLIQNILAVIFGIIKGLAILSLHLFILLVQSLFAFTLNAIGYIVEGVASLFASIFFWGFLAIVLFLAVIIGGSLACCFLPFALYFLADVLSTKLVLRFYGLSIQEQTCQRKTFHGRKTITTKKQGLRFLCTVLQFIALCAAFYLGSLIPYVFFPLALIQADVMPSFHPVILVFYISVVLIYGILSTLLLYVRFYFLTKDKVLTLDVERMQKRIAKKEYKRFKKEAKQRTILGASGSK